MQWGTVKTHAMGHCINCKLMQWGNSCNGATLAMGQLLQWGRAVMLRGSKHYIHKGAQFSCNVGTVLGKLPIDMDKWIYSVGSGVMVVFDTYVSIAEATASYKLLLY